MSDDQEPTAPDPPLPRNGRYIPYDELPKGRCQHVNMGPHTCDPPPPDSYAADDDSTLLDLLLNSSKPTD